MEHLGLFLKETPVNIGKQGRYTELFTGPQRLSLIGYIGCLIKT